MDVLSTTRKAGHVYVLRCGNEYKIGHARTYANVLQRQRSMKTGRGTAVYLVYALTVCDMLRAERILHSIFIGDNIGGEWFLLTDKNKILLDAIFQQTLESTRLEGLGLKHYDIPV